MIGKIIYRNTANIIIMLTIICVFLLAKNEKQNSELEELRRFINDVEECLMDSELEENKNPINYYKECEKVIYESYEFESEMKAHMSDTELRAR